MTQQIDYDIIQSIKDQLEIYFNKMNPHQEWLDLKSAAKYANVSYNTFMKFRQMGLKVAEIDGVKRVKKSEIDRFLQEHSF
ncbi:hypothetical protein J8TS2_22570 [Lederbergia ruris]|uniref:Helix-turn-helix domain-containing protein n=1 Tax=Lederbergia ruris TaxID=217495 RepID=A0ABQ4KIZ6_9BACI|nr:MULTISPECIES: helix-turn-helix domain-containing protein [Bacillales]GIN57938.1 hypothetical protein J8TS2_22570 [Lederbergia ruris]